MKLNNKGFSLIEIIAVVTLMGILSTLAVASYTGYQEKVTLKSYKAMETSAYSAAQNYIEQYGIIVPSDGTVREISINELVDSGLLSKLQDPKSKGNFCHSGSSVKVSKQKNEGNKLEEYTYVVTIKCSAYTSPNGGIVFKS